MATKGVDVSYWQKEIDWNKVKASGINLRSFAAATATEV